MILEAVCFLRSDDGTELILKDVFANPRHRHGKQLIAIDVEQIVSQAASEEAKRITGRTEVMIFEDALESFIPEVCDTFQKYLRYTEEHPNDSSFRRIVVASKGRELAGLSAEVRQVVCLRDFARVFYNVEDARLSEDALRWMWEWGKKGAGKTLSETLKKLFFPEGGVAKRALCVFDGYNGAKSEMVLWLVKHVASRGSYLEYVAKQEGVHVGTFRSAYITGAAQWLDESVFYNERRDAIREANVRMSDADIRQFIACCAGESTSRVAPWLNCETDAERAELLRRCVVDGIASNAVKHVYPEVAAYLHTDIVFGDVTLENYFREYRELKITGRVTPEFYERTQRVVPPSSVQSRDAMVQRYASDKGCALLVVDAMGAEWLPMLEALVLQRNMGVDSIAVGTAHLPTTTLFNNIHWPDAARRLQDIKRFDNIAHYGVETHETRRAEENLAAALDVIGGEVLPRVADGLLRFELGLGHAETLIEDYVWDRIKEEVVKTAGGWGLVQLGYRSPDGGNPRGCFTLLEYKNFCPYTINIDAYREARSQFTAEEWIDVVLGAIDYNPEGYEDWVQKHTVLTRLLPFIEPRLNLNIVLFRFDHFRDHSLW